MSRPITKIASSVNSGIASAAARAVANPARASYKIQNLGTNALFVKEGASASATDFSYILAAGTGNDNGTGGSYESPSGEVWIGALSTAGTLPRYVLVQRQENSPS